MRVELELRNVPRFRVLEYLEQAGGTPHTELAVRGDGWSAWLEELPPAQIITLTVPRDLLIIEGDDAAVADVQAFMRRKTMRGGG